MSLCVSASDGFNVCAFAYGQTGSGKTWTLAGEAGGNEGVARRAMSQVFVVGDDVQQKGYDFKVSATMIELYIDTFYDLLDPQKKAVTLQRAQGPTPAKLVDVTELFARDAQGLQDIFAKGEQNRNTRSTQMNVASSRSHMVYSIKMQTLKPDGTLVRQGKLAIVDLAGSERLAKSGVDGQGAREAIAINKALTALGNVIENLSKKSRHIPFRDHELTQMLQEYLGGNSKTLMFVNVSPSQLNFSESKCSLMFAQRAKKVVVASKEQIEANAGKVAKKKEELRELNHKLVVLQKRSHDCQLEARKKEAEVVGLSSNIRQHREEATRLQREHQKLKAKVDELRVQLQRLDAAGDDVAVTPSPAVSPPRSPSPEAPASAFVDRAPPCVAAPARGPRPSAQPAQKEWQPPPGELRIDPEDDCAYGWEDFQEEYGDDAKDKWLSCKIAPPGYQNPES